MRGREYTKYEKPVKRRDGVIYDGNLRGECSMGTTRDFMFGIGHGESFNGFSGTNEFESFPIRQLFLNKHKMFPSEWDTGYIKDKDLEEFVKLNKKSVLATHYSKDKSINKCLLYLGGKENIYVYLYVRGYDGTKDFNGVCLLFTEKTRRVNKLMDYFIGLVIPKLREDEKGHLNILVRSNNGYYLEPKKINCPEIDFSVNYNEDFEPIHKLMIEKLSVDNSKGLFLLHGEAGTGKTTYIRYLINNLKKKVIYIPPNMANAISDPDLIKFFMQNSNSVLVIEDAENILAKRASSSVQAVSNILNLTDGLLSDVANIQVVATFNTNILNIDEALLRKGRLIAKYEFTKLEEKRVKKLGEKLGVKINNKNTLADIYNSQETSFEKKKNSIGFKK